MNEIAEVLTVTAEIKLQGRRYLERGPQTDFQRGRRKESGEG